MRSYARLVTQLGSHWLARRLGTPVPLPVNLTLGITYQCNSRCATCRVYEREPVDELSLSEWSKVFDSLGGAPYWVTISGGEPFLDSNLGKVYKLLLRKCHPAMVNIPTNGLLVHRIKTAVNCMSGADRRTKLVINVSMDHDDPEKNDLIRGVDGDYGKALRTIRALQDLKAPNLTVGVHSVVSRFNVDDIDEVVSGLSRIPADPSHYITEIAENRNELGTIGMDITPYAEQYQRALEMLLCHAEGQPKTLIQAFRVEYYRDTLRWLHGEGRIPCWAGRTSAQVTPDGEVVACCTRYVSMGNLRDYDYDFRRVWNSDRAREVRATADYCQDCPMANAWYTSSLMNLKTATRVVRNML